MLFSWILLIVVVPSHLAITTTQSSKVLDVVEIVSKSDNSSKKLTCTSQDDDAALTWNYDLNENKDLDRYDKFEPAKPKTQKSTECAIWRSQQCSVTWEEKNGWTTVNSLLKPMGPVTDFRWKGFREFILNHKTGRREYQNVLQLDSSDGTVVFSVRGTRDIEIDLCENVNPITSSCSWIKIAVQGTYSVIKNCLSEALWFFSSIGNEHCEEVDSVAHKTAVLDAYEWRTFRIQWISKGKLIKLFNDTAGEAFLQGHVNRWHSVRNILIRSKTAAHMKFHNYEYSLASMKNAVLSTTKFHHRDINFCANMLVSLCPECELRVSLTNTENYEEIASTSISGDESFHSNGLRIWQSIKLNMTMQSAVPTSVRLRIISVLNKNNRTDIWWAMDNLRVCEETDGVRKSTITVPISDLTNNGTTIKCQKLFHNKIVTTDLGTIEKFDDIRKLRQLVQESLKLCPPGCTTFHRVNGNPAGCRCYRQISKKTEKFCFDIVPGKKNITLVSSSNSTKCIDSSDNCYMYVYESREYEGLPNPINRSFLCTFVEQLKSDIEYVVQVNTRNEQRFNERIRTLKAGPCKIRNLNIESVSADSVTGKWEPPLQTDGGIRNYTVIIQRTKLFGCEDFSRISPPEPESSKTVTETTASFSGLHPYAEYNFTVIANSVDPGRPQSKLFTKKSLDKPTSTISNLRDNGSHILWDYPENCTTVTGPAKTTRLLLRGLSDWAKNWTSENQTKLTHYDLKNEKLLPYTQYKLRAYVSRGYNKPVNKMNYQEWQWTTPSDAPLAVKNLDVYETDAAKDTISLRWEPPYPPYGVIESYQLLLLSRNSLIENNTFEVFQLKNCTPYHVCLEDWPVSNISKSANLKLQVSAKNVNVSRNGAKNSILLKLDDLYDTAPSQPEGLAAITGENETVTLKWTHDPFTPTKLVRFRIQLEPLRRDPGVKVLFYYPVDKKQNVYTGQFNLENSTQYRINIEAFNYRNRSSTAMEKNISTFGGVAADSKYKLDTEHHDTKIKLKVSIVGNLMRNITATVMVQRLLLCKQKSSGNLSLFTNQRKERENASTQWIGEKNQTNSGEPIEFIFDVDCPYGVEQNCFFQRLETYKFIVVFKNSCSGESVFLESGLITFTDQNSSEDDSKIWLVIIPILVICVLPLLIWYRKQWKIWWESRRLCNPLLARTISFSDDSVLIGGRIMPQIEATGHQVSTREKKLGVIAFDPVRVEELEQYVEEALASGSLELQWKMISAPGDSSQLCEYGSSLENIPKNRRNNAIPYDNNRIILEKIPGDPHSDYINASYIQGYGKRKAYIATQGPKRDGSTNTDTVLDFWRMIWQEDVRVICMLTDVIENGERKCEQYWPEVGKNVEFGDAFVLNLDHQVFTDYTIRTLQLICREGKREIKHFHYTAWLEHGVPMFTQSLASFMKKLLATPIGKGPMVVHGSAGVGRTGTLILCDICLRQAVKERMFDIPTVTLKMRRDRANMVDSVQQYLFAHLVIAECKILERTQVPCSKRLEEKVDELRKQLPSDIQRLDKIVWQDRALHSLAKKSLINDNVTSRELLQPQRGDHDRIEQSNGERGFFDAIDVEGVQREKQYLATRLPSPSTLPDLWSFVANKKIELIILLQRPDVDDAIKCDIIPTEPDIYILSHLEMEKKTVPEDGTCFTIDKLLLTDTLQDEPMKQPVTILTYTEWVNTMNGTLPPVDSLVSFWMASEKIHRTKNPTLIICRDSVTGCGLYLALSFLLERMALEGVCDVISAVRAIQRSEPNFVQSLNQFEFLYDAAINYNQRFATYSNFS